MRFSLTETLSLGPSYSYHRQLSNGLYDAIPHSFSGNSVSVGLAYSIPVFF
jgi:hypothetical protein